jgi:hypothetical protein
MHKTVATVQGEVYSSVDELYRLSLGLENPRTYARDTSAADPNAAWTVQGKGRRSGSLRYVAYAAPEGRRGAFFRSPDEQWTVIVLTNDEKANVREIVTRLVARLSY